jgi:L-threonylcarbamoyladenylate synthase
LDSILAQESEETRALAAGLVAAGGVVAFRTDTFYGLGADPFNRRAVRRVKALKGREGGKPVLVVIGDAADAGRFIAGSSKLFDALGARFWPGALTLVVRARPEVPEELTAGTGTVGLRLPDDDEVRALVRACGGALTATSANLAGEPPARTARQVQLAFPEGLDLIIDGGAAPGDKPSTVLDVSGPGARLIREGPISSSTLRQALDQLGAELLPR